MEYRGREQTAGRNRMLHILVGLVIVLALLVVGLAVGLVRVQQEAENSLNTATLNAVRATAALEILQQWDRYGTNEDLENHRAWAVDASVTKSGTITIVSITPSLESQKASDGVIFRERITETYKISNLIVTRSEVVPE